MIAMFKLYEVDPEADTLLIIPYPSRPFAPWTDSSETPSSSPSDVYAGILRGTSRPPNIYASIASAPELRVKVSSQHLVLASKHFRNRFRYHRSNNNDSSPTSSDGRTHITLSPGYDPQAVITVMDIVHGRGRKVPRTLPDVDALAKIAVVVDAFKLHDAVEVYAERWFTHLSRPGGGGSGGWTRVGDEAVSSYGRELILWIYASYVFRQAEVFKAATRVAVLRSDGPIPSLGLQVREGVISKFVLVLLLLSHLSSPILLLLRGGWWWESSKVKNFNAYFTLPPKTGEIESRRQQAISAALDAVHGALGALQQDETGTLSCSLGCDTFLLGSLVKSLRRARLGFPRPARPWPGVSLLDVSRAVGQAQDALARQLVHLGPSWGLLGAPTVAPAATTVTGKRKTPNAQPVGPSSLLLTPESSPEPERAAGGGFRDVHTCEARDGYVGARLEELERGVEGLDLESKLGYYLY